MKQAEEQIAQYEIRGRTVQEMPSRMQPRELLERHGAEKVPDEVLLAIILRTGIPKKNVLELAHELVVRYGSLTELSRASVDQLMQHQGMGKVKAQVLKASLELARRLGQETVEDRPVVRTPEQAVHVLEQEAKAESVEIFWTLFLDTKYRLIRPPWEVSRGILDASLVHPREVFKEAIRSACAAVILAHNHPSGDSAPSAEDIRITRQLIEAGKLVDIEVLDHVILGHPTKEDPKGFSSLRESGLVEF